jgi:MYXO-CTERM domain-containing protein
MIFFERRLSFCTRSLTALPLAFVATMGALPARADVLSPYDDTLSLETFVSGVDGATDIAWAPDGRVVVVRKDGTITIVDTDGIKSTIDDTFDNVDTESEKGLTGVVADPSVENGFFFYCDNGPTDEDKHRVYHGVLSASDNTLTVDTDNPIVGPGRNPGDPGLEGPRNHDGGGLVVYQNHLYVSVGDTGSNATPPVNKYGACLNKGNGKILRLNLDGTIPSDNPLVGISSVTACDAPDGDWDTAAPDKRIFAWGFRNPWRFWIDSHSGLMWIGDVGETTREEISVGGGNEHYGWPFNEGNVTWPDGDTTGPDGTLDGESCETGTPSRACIPPVHDYPHTEGNCVIGGLIPEGCGWTNAFDGKLLYLFADHGSNWLHALEVRDDRTGVTSEKAIEVSTFDAGTGVASIRQGPDEAVYIVMNAGNSVLRLTPKQATGPDCMSTGGDGGAGGNGGEAGASDAGGPPLSAGGTAGANESGGTAGTPDNAGTSSGAAAGTKSSGGKGGASAGSGSGTAGSTSGGKPSSSGGSGGDTKDSGGCGCRTTGPADAGLGAWAVALALGSVVARRRRRPARA